MSDEQRAPSNWRFVRYKEAYLEMARRSKYRPGAPSDGHGNIIMSAKDLHDPDLLDREAIQYALRFVAEDDRMDYPMGCPHGAFNKAFFYTIEVARLLCGGVGAEKPAIELLRMAIEEMEAVQK